MFFLMNKFIEPTSSKNCNVALFLKNILGIQQVKNTFIFLELVVVVVFSQHMRAQLCMTV